MYVVSKETSECGLLQAVFEQCTISKSYSAYREKQKSDHQGSQLPKLHFLSFFNSSRFFLSIVSLAPSHTSTPTSLHHNAVMKTDVQVLISICFGMHTASLSIPDPPIS